MKHDPQSAAPSPDTAKLALQATRSVYDEEGERFQLLTSRAVSLVSLAGVLLSIYVAFVLRLLIEAGIDRLDYLLAILTFLSLILACVFGLLVFAVRRFQRLDVAHLTTEEFMGYSAIDAATALSEGYVRVIAENEGILNTKHLFLQIGMVLALTGIGLISVQAILLLAGKLTC